MKVSAEISGIDDLIKDIKELGDDIDEVADRMLDAGAEVLEDEWRQTIRRKGYVKTGAMRDSIGTKKNKKKKTADVFPQGSQKIVTKTKGVKKVSNATKAYVLHHGRKSNPKTGRDAIKASYFVTEIQQKGGIRAKVAMEEILDEELKKKGM